MRTNTKYTLREYGDEPHLFVILEDGHNVLNVDAVNFGLRREFKRRLSRILKDLVRAINRGVKRWKTLLKN